MKRANNNLAPLIDLANLSDEGLQRFMGQYPKLLERKHILPMRELVRELWHGGTRADEIARELLFAEKHLQFAKDERPDIWSPLDVDWRRGTFTYHGVYPFQNALYDLLRHSDRTMICARPDCPAPYFIAWNRKPRRYCGTDCRDAAKRENDLKWWKDHGDKWRKKRDQQSKRKRGKQ